MHECTSAASDGAVAVDRQVPQRRGVIRGDCLNATALMGREGKPPLENWVVAAVPR